MAVPLLIMHIITTDYNSSLFTLARVAAPGQNGTTGYRARSQPAFLAALPSGSAAAASIALPLLLVANSAE